jgi:hypothetical protein
VLRSGNGFPAVPSLPDDLDVGLRLEDQPEPTADQCLVVSHKNPNHGGAGLSGSRTLTV